MGFMKDTGSDYIGGERFFFLAPASVLLLAITIVSLNPFGWASQWREFGFDTLQSLGERTSDSTDPVVHLVEIDNESLDRLGDWPWPRTRYAELIAQAEVAGARAIIVDDPLTRADPTSPTVVTRHLDSFDAFSATAPAGTPAGDHDAALADILSFSRAVIPVRVRRPGEYPGTATVDAAAIDGLDWALDAALRVPETALRYFPAYEVADTPLPAYAAAGVTFGFDSALPDADGILRRLPLAARFGDNLVGSDVLEAVRLSDGIDAIEVEATGTFDRFSLIERNGLQALSVGKRQVPVSADGAMRFFAKDPDTLARLSAWRLIEDPAARSALTNHVVVIAPTADGTVTRMTTPSGHRLSPGEAKALALDQIFADSHLRRPDWAPTLEDIALIGVGLALVGLVAVGRSAYAIPGALLTILGLSAFSWLAYRQQAVLFDALVPSTGLGLLALSIVWVRLAEMAARKRQLFHALESKLPGQAASSLSTSEGRRLLAGQVRKITILYCDLRGYAGFSDLHRDEPAWMAYQIQRFHGYVSDQITSSGGLADTRHGTAVMGFWNAPNDDPDHATNACDCALRLLDGLEAFNRELEAESGHRPFLPLSIAAGINTGHALVGNLGTARRVDYTAHGDPVIHARLLQSYSEVYGSAVIVGEHTHNAVKNRYALLEIDRLGVEGRDYGLRTFALLGNPVVRANPRFKALQQTHGELLKAYCAQDWATARARVTVARQMRSAIPALYDFYETRIRYYETNPPGPDWAGIFRVPVR